MDTLTIQLPFEGFYESKYSGAIDHIEEIEIENLTEREEEDQPPELRLEADDFAEILMRVTAYGDAYRATAKCYVDAFNSYVSEELELPLGLTFESMDSPKEYNFTTDRVYAYIPVPIVQALFDRSAADKHKTLAAVIKDRFTSRDGFFSGYPNTLWTWLAKPVTDWDHNELETLLLANIELAKLDDDWGWRIYDTICDGDDLYLAWSDAVDWLKFDAECAERREDKRQEILANDPDYVAPTPRCPLTLDLFGGASC